MRIACDGLIINQSTQTLFGGCRCLVTKAKFRVRRKRKESSRARRKRAPRRTRARRSRVPLEVSGARRGASTRARSCLCEMNRLRKSRLPLAARKQRKKKRCALAFPDVPFRSRPSSDRRRAPKKTPFRFPRSRRRRAPTLRRSRRRRTPVFHGSARW